MEVGEKRRRGEERRERERQDERVEEDRETRQNGFGWVLPRRLTNGASATDWTYILAAIGSNSKLYTSTECTSTSRVRTRTLYRKTPLPRGQHHFCSRISNRSTAETRHGGGLQRPTAVGHSSTTTGACPLERRRPDVNSAFSCLSEHPCS
jgi:hypothetical protein